MEAHFKVNSKEWVIPQYIKFESGKEDEGLRDWLQYIQAEEIGEHERFVPNEKQIQNLRRECELALENNRLEKVTALREWFKSNSHLPQPSDVTLYKFMWASKDKEEVCRKHLLRYFGLRGTDEEIFKNRDPCLEAPLAVYNYSVFFTMPILTDELYRINISMLTDYNPQVYNAIEWMRRLFYLSDLRIRDDFCLGEIMIFNLKGVTLQHAAKFHLGLARKFVLASEGALPTKVKQVHLVYAPPFIDKIMSFFRPLMKEKLSKRIVIHTDNLDNLYNYIPKSCLPMELGGNLKSVHTYSERLAENIKQNRDWFKLEEQKIRQLYAEGKRDELIYMDSGELFGMDGTFKKLDID